MEQLLFTVTPPEGVKQQKLAWQPGSGNLLAVHGGNLIQICDRVGNIVDKISLAGICQSFEWDSDGDTLAAIYGTSTILLWHAVTKRNQTLEIGLKDVPTLIIWAREQAVLAIGTEKGNLLIYSKRTGRKIPVLGKHNKRITCGAWSDDDLVALGSDDKTISINTSDGDVVQTVATRAQPSMLKFTRLKVYDSKSKRENTLSVVIGRKTLLILTLSDYDNPQELAFQQKYGTIGSYEWFGDGNIGIGFNNGFFVAVSTNPSQIGHELFQVRDFSTLLCEVVLSKSLGRLALIGDDSIKFHDIDNLKHPIKPISLTNENFEFSSWSIDGSIMAVSSRDSGKVYGFLTRLQVLCAAYGTHLITLTGFKKISVKNVDDKIKEQVLSVDVEPDSLHVGPSYLGYSSGSRVWFYYFEEGDISFVAEKTYNDLVNDVTTNSEYASVLSNGKVYLHPVEDGGEQHILPNDENINYAVTAHFLTKDCLVYSLENGLVEVLSLGSMTKVFHVNHRCRVEEVSVHMNGYLACFQDFEGDTFLHSFIDGQVLKVGLRNADSILWDACDTEKAIFVVMHGKLASYYIYQEDGIDSPSITELGEQDIPQYFPLHLCDGKLYLCEEGGRIATVTAPYHVSKLKKTSKDSKDKVKKILQALGRVSDALLICAEDNDEGLLQSFAETSLKMYDFDGAIAAYTKLKAVKTAMVIADLRHVEDKFLLQGHIATLTKNFDLAETMFLQSDPLCALKMRIALQQWDKALRLAKQYATYKVANISYDYAKQLEFYGNHTEARTFFEKALQGELPPETRNKCMSGLARTLIRSSDIKQGIKTAEKVKGEKLLVEIGDMLEDIKEYTEASKLYEKAGNWDKAASVSIKLKQWSKLKGMIERTVSPKIQLFYARALEQEKDYKNSVRHYVKGGDTNSAIRVLLNSLNDVEAAVKLYEESKSSDTAALIANFCRSTGDNAMAIRFLIDAGKKTEAFEIARTTNSLHVFSDLSGASASSEDFLELAKYFHLNSNVLEAGKYYWKANEVEKALSVLLSDWTSNDAIRYAVDIALESKSDNVVDKVLRELNEREETKHYGLELYVMKGMHLEAAVLASTISANELRNGNFRAARSALLESVKRLRQHSLSVPIDLIHTLELVHSYLLVRIHLKRSNHVAAAHMLLRISRSVSKFQTHAVQILTTAVIECHRAGLRQSAYRLAILLLSPKTRDSIDPKYKSKVESVARKPPRAPEEEDESGAPTPCPYCDAPVPSTDLHCSDCRNSLPMCIATGYHVVSDDFTMCASCRFPTTMSQFLQIVRDNEPCPLCEEPLTEDDLRTVAFRSFRYT